LAKSSNESYATGYNIGHNNQKIKVSAIRVVNWASSRNGTQQNGRAGYGACGDVAFMGKNTRR
jgi:hypothetical protein